MSIDLLDAVCPKCNKIGFVVHKTDGVILIKHLVENKDCLSREIRCEVCKRKFWIHNNFDINITCDDCLKLTSGCRS